MSEETTTQSVADEPKDSATQESTEVTGAQDQGGEDTFEAALSEWDASADGASPSSQKDDTQSNDEVSALRQEVQSFRQEREQERFNADLNRVVSQIRGDFAADEVSDKLIKSWVDMTAREDARVATAWLNRDKDPAKFNRTVSALAKEFAKENARLRKRDENATADREAVSFAVKGASRSAPEHKQPDYSKMTDQEFANQIQEDYGYRPM